MVRLSGCPAVLAWAVTTALLAGESLRAQTPGTLDASFGNGGLRHVNIPVNGSPRSNNATGLFVQPDGRIVLGGAAITDGTGPQRMVAVRLTAAGDLDVTFSGDGIAIIDGDPDDDGNPRFVDGRVAPGPSGGVYLFNGVLSSDNIGTGWSLARLNASGGLVGSFGDGGLVKRIDLMQGFADIVALGNGRPVVLDDYFDEGGTIPNNDWAVRRYLPTGLPDTNFGNGGTRVVGFNLGELWDDYAFVLAQQPDGKLVAAGAAEVGTTSENLDFAVARLTAGGGFDTSFSGDGRAVIDMGADDDTVRAIAIDHSRRIYLAGVSGGDCAIVRLLPNGSLDSSFSGDGKLKFSFASDTPGAFDQAFGLVPQGDGKLLVVGRATTTAGTGRRVGVARLNENGSFDATFSSLSGRPGRQIFDWSTASGTVSVGRTVALAGDGRIVVAGGAERAPGDMDFVAARLRNDYIFADSFDWGGFGHWSSHTD